MRLTHGYIKVYSSLSCGNCFLWYLVGFNGLADIKAHFLGKLDLSFLVLFHVYISFVSYRHIFFSQDRSRVNHGWEYFHPCGRCAVPLWALWRPESLYGKSDRVSSECESTNYCFLLTHWFKYMDMMLNPKSFQYIIDFV